ncbi:outer membrane protein assembly factor BamD [Bacteroidetes/Chlorobi group bacterium ChocPot_Mid]|jgi:outer membrane protein assembly factor BamD|nr:MAG: outer membrane protein assembly factor BamD [Bacteroidetes/Chlorobi group bacterium ChocPot_Mid]
MNSKKIILVSFCILIFTLLLSCASSDKTEMKSAEAIYNKGMSLFNDKEYLEAYNTLDLIRLQYPASQYADDAQFYMAEARFKREEYILAQFSYNLLKRLYPNSPYYKESAFKAAMSFYYLSPQYDLDPDNTTKAIKSMSEFQATYPGDSLSVLMDTYIQELRDRLAQKEFEIAQLYRKLDSPASALIYYDIVINEYDDTKFFELAYIGKIEVLLQMKKWEQAKTTISYFYILFKSSENLEKVKKLESAIPKDYSNF